MSLMAELDLMSADQRSCLQRIVKALIRYPDVDPVFLVYAF